MRRLHLHLLATPAFTSTTTTSTSTTSSTSCRCLAPSVAPSSTTTDSCGRPSKLSTRTPCSSTCRRSSRRAPPTAAHVPTTLHSSPLTHRPPADPPAPNRHRRQQKSLHPHRALQVLPGGDPDDGDGCTRPRAAGRARPPARREGMGLFFVTRGRLRIGTLGLAWDQRFFGERSLLTDRLWGRRSGGDLLRPHDAQSDVLHILHATLRRATPTSTPPTPPHLLPLLRLTLRPPATPLSDR